MKIFPALFIILILPLMAFAELTCEDSDSGPEDVTKPLPFITKAGTVKTLNDTKGDFCIEKEGSNELEQESLWVREYYCYAGKAKNHDYQCFAYGYTKCKMTEGIGKCVEGLNSLDDSADNAKADEPKENASEKSSTRNCGDDKVQQGEDCEPPEKLCVTKNDEPGVCSAFCICIPYEFKSGNATKPNVTVEEVNVSISNKTDKDVEISKDTQKVLEDIKDDRPLKFNESIGYKLTKGVTDAVKHFFDWIGSLFKGD